MLNRKIFFVQDSLMLLEIKLCVELTILANRLRVSYTLTFFASSLAKCPLAKMLSLLQIAFGIFHKNCLIAKTEENILHFQAIKRSLHQINKM